MIYCRKSLSFRFCSATYTQSNPQVPVKFEAMTLIHCGDTSNEYKNRDSEEITFSYYVCDACAGRNVAENTICKWGY